MAARGHPLLAGTHRTLAVLEAATMGTAILALFAIMVIIVADVAARYLLKSPLPWAFDLISLYLMPAGFFLALAHTLEKDHHVNVDIVLNAMPGRVANGMRAVGHALAIAVFAGIAYAATVRTWEAWESNAVTSGIIQYPTWIASAIVVVGAGLLTLRTAFRALAFAVAATGGDARLPGAKVAAAAEEEEI